MPGFLRDRSRRALQRRAAREHHAAAHRGIARQASRGSASLSRSDGDVGGSGESPRMKWLFAIAVVLLIAGAIVRMRNSQTYLLASVVDGVLYRDDVRREHEFENAVREIKARTVV